MASREELEKKISADLSKMINERTNLQGIQKQEMTDLVNYLVGRDIGLSEILSEILTALERLAGHNDPPLFAQYLIELKEKTDAQTTAENFVSLGKRDIVHLFYKSVFPKKDQFDPPQK